MDGKNIEDVEVLLARLRRERAALVEEAMRKDGELALMGRAVYTKTDAQKRRELIAAKKDLEIRALKTKEKIRRVEEAVSLGLKGIGDLGDEEGEGKEVVQEINQEIENELDEIPVTDHAVVRWLERKMGLDIPMMKRDIYQEAMGEGGKIFKSGPYYKVVKDGYVYFVDSRNKTVITFYEYKFDLSNSVKWKEIKNG